VSATLYARPNALVRALVARLLTPEQKRSLIGTPGLEETLRLLAGTPYGPELEAASRDGGPLFPVERALQRSLIAAYERVLHTLGGAPQRLVVEMLRRLEVDNLKAILRGLARGAVPDEVRALLLPLGRHSRLPVDRLLSVTNVGAAVAALSDLPVGRVLRDALPRYERERSLFPLEVALDLSYYRQLWATAESLAGGDREDALRLLGTRYDTTNVDWMLRYKVVYGLSAVEIYNYALPYGRRIDDRVIRQAGAAPDLAGLIDALPEPYRGLLAPLAGTRELWSLEVTLNRLLQREARGALTGYPFHIGTMLGYLWLKEGEVHDLEAILEGKRLGRSPEGIESFLWGKL
jgi:V/A-type H+-transporting ATPase subunit C